MRPVERLASVFIIPFLSFAKLPLGYTGRDSLNYSSHQFRNWWQRQSTGLSHLVFRVYPSGQQKSRHPHGCLLFWYTGRDSNPQPSEPESDALSIEPPVHLLYSLAIITGFSGFVKGEVGKFFRILPHFSPKVVVFLEFLCYNAKKECRFFHRKKP